MILFKLAPRCVRVRVAQDAVAGVMSQTALPSESASCSSGEDGSGGGSGEKLVCKWAGQVHELVVPLESTSLGALREMIYARTRVAVRRRRRTGADGMCAMRLTPRPGRCGCSLRGRN